mgnify:CR=1 FL=1
MLILTFEDSEEEILNHIVSYVSTGTKAFQVVENARTELRFDGLEIDVAKRLVRKQKQEIDLTFTEFEILHLLARNLGIHFPVSHLETALSVMFNFSANCACVRPFSFLQLAINFPVSI